jgi:hypothetical protein
MPRSPGRCPSKRRPAKKPTAPHLLRRGKAPPRAGLDQLLKVRFITRSGRCAAWFWRAASVKGFGCRPVVAIRALSEGRRPKASQEGTSGPPGWRLTTMGI